jgi:hypothetical protein
MVGSPERHGLDHHCLSGGLWARLDVTSDLWIAAG